MSIDVGKGKKLLTGAVSAALNSTKVQKTAASLAPEVTEKLPVPSSSQVLAYHTEFRGKTKTVSKEPFVLTRAIVEDRKKELIQFAEDSDDGISTSYEALTEL